MNRLSVVAAAIIFGLAVSGAAVAAEGKLGYVDVQKALNMSDAGKDAKEQLSAKVKNYQDQINARQEELKKLKDELEKQSTAITEASRAEKEKVYSQKLKDFQRFTKDAQEELQGRDEEFTKRILEEFEKVVQEFGKANGYSVIFARTDSMLFTDPSADVTEALVKQFNAGRKK